MRKRASCETIFDGSRINLAVRFRNTTTWRTTQHLLSFALQIALEFSEQVGVYAVVVDAKNERAKASYSRLGFSESLDDPLCLYLPIAMLKKAVTSPAPKMS